MQSLLHHVHAELSLRQLSRSERVVLGGIIVCALVLRANLQHGRVFSADEIGTLIYLKKSTAYLLTHFDVWLSMNYFILAEKGIVWLCGTTDWRLTLLPLVAAVAVVPLTASLALKFTGFTRTALIAASLAAFNPYLVSYGTVIRSYSLLVALSLLVINEFFHWYQKRNWWSGARCAAAVLLLLLAHLNGIYTVAFLILLFATETASAGWSGGRKFVWESRTLWVPLAAAAILMVTAYWRLLPDIEKVNRDWTDIAPTSLAYLPELFTSYTGSTGYPLFLIVLFLLVGIWSATQKQRQLLLLCAAVSLGPILMSLQGVSHYSWAYTRFLIFSVPLLLILIAEGIDWLSRHVRRRTYASAGAWGLTALITLFWTPNLYAQLLTKRNLPYVRVAKFLHTEWQKGDVIVAEYNTGSTLTQFFEQSEDRIMLPGKYFSKVAGQLDTPLGGRVFYVTPPSVLMGRKPRVQRFGRIEVTIYNGSTARELLQKWREDLLRRTAGRITPFLEDDYQLLALIERRLPSGQSPDRWQLLAERCRGQTLARRYFPRQLLKAVRPEMFP